MLTGLRHLLLALLLALLAAVPAWAKVSGSLEWNWVDFQSRSDDGDIDASHFLQKYSFLYSASGLFNQGRAGSWNASLGYEWAALDTSINDLDETVKTDKILYKGELIFAPGGLPLRLEAFSYDLDRTAPNYSSMGRVLDPRIATDVGTAGQHTVTGLTLWAGIKNGSYLGQYREVLSQLPKLLIDYRETYVRNLDALREEHNRMRDLAFVSLNKKDNWFHYRVTEYEDFEDPRNNYEDRAYVLGTIDHTLQRQWINLTNWIQLSVDGSLNQTQDANSFSSDVYTLNLFAKLKRRDWTLSNFNTLQRTVGDEGGVEKRIDLPVFASGQIDPRTSWRLSVIQSSEEEVTPGEPMWNEHLSFVDYQLEMQRPSGLLATPKVAFDLKRGSDDTEGQALKAGIELRTDARRDLLSTWMGEYSVALFNSNANNDSYLEQQLTLGFDYRPSPRMRMGGRQQLALGVGSYNSESTEYIKPVVSGDAGNYYARTDSVVDGTAWRSQTELYLELLGSSRWTNRFGANYDIVDRGGDRTDHLDLSHTANYSTDRLLLTFKTLLQAGDEISLDRPSSELMPFDSRLGVIDRALNHSTTVSFAPSRSWQTGGDMSLVWADGDQGSGGILHLGQEAIYSLYAAQGVPRRLFSLQQELIYERLLGDSGEGSPWFAGLTMVSWWYPFRALALGARGEFRHYGETGANVLEYGLMAEVPFDKFQVAVTYEYGRADDDWPMEGRAGAREHRWEVDVKKTF